MLNVSLATGAMALTPEGGWMYLVVCRFFVGFAVTGLYSVDITLMQEFSPAHKRGWFTGLTTTMLPAGSLLAALLGAFAAPYIGWRGMVAVGLLPALLCLYIRAFVPESPHWLLRRGRVEEARRVARLGAADRSRATIPLPAVPPPVEKTRWLEIFKYPRSIFAGCLTGLTQTGGVALALWQVTLFVMVLDDRPPEASKLVIWVSISAIVGRFFCSWISDAWGRRASGIFSCLVSAAVHVPGRLHAQRLHRRLSMFFLMILLAELLRQRQLLDRRPVYGRDVAGSAARQRHGPRLRRRQSRQVHRAGRAGADRRLVQLCKPEGDARRADPGLQLFRLWYVFGAVAFWLIGMETSGRTIDEIDSALTRPAAVPVRVAESSARGLSRTRKTAGTLSDHIEPSFPRKREPSGKRLRGCPGPRLRGGDEKWCDLIGERS